MIDHQSMTAENSNGVIGDQANDGYIVEFCIQPAVYVYNKENLMDVFDESLIPSASQNFVPSSGEWRVGLRQSMKAVVILRKGNTGS